MIKIGLGQDSHRFETEPSDKPLMMGGIVIPDSPGLMGNSDADVILHAVTNAISSLTGHNILGAVADRLCNELGMTDSAVYLNEALNDIKNGNIAHVAISLECLRPKLAAYIPAMRIRIASLLNIPVNSVGITATTGEGLTAFGRGEGVFCTVIMTADLP